MRIASTVFAMAVATVWSAGGPAMTATQAAWASEALANPDGSRATPSRLFSFDIPSQALSSALKAYLAASRAQLFYETTLTAGRQSTGVRGDFTAEAALEELLAGTGIVARPADVDAFILVPIVAEPNRLHATTTRLQASFLGVLQNSVLDALCRNSRTRPGGYKVAVELWIARTGLVERSALIGSTGDATRDAALVATLGGVMIGSAPPEGAPQPFILTIASPSYRNAGDCLGR